MTSDERAEYGASIDRVLDGTSAKPVFNGNQDHAAVVTERFLRRGTHLRMLTEKFDPGCYDRSSVRAALRAFLAKPDSTLQILIEDQSAAERLARDPDIGPAIEEKRIELRLVEPEVCDAYPYNFLLHDSAFRFESNRSHPVATVAGGEEYRLDYERLAEIFGILWTQGSRPLAA